VLFWEFNDRFDDLEFTLKFLLFTTHLLKLAVQSVSYCFATHRFFDETRLALRFKVNPSWIQQRAVDTLSAQQISQFSSSGAGPSGLNDT